jgi:uncharacterized protein (DUF4415 family)
MRKRLPASSAQWEAVIAAAPGKDRPLTKREEAKLAGAVVVRRGGYAAVTAALASKRKQGERGPQVAPTKQLVSVRFSPEVLEYFKGTGAGWQTRMNDVLSEWVSGRTSKRGKTASA